MQISPNDHLGNLENLWRFSIKETILKLGKSWSPNNWTYVNIMGAKHSVGSASYACNLNQFYLPVQYMHHFYFNINRPMYLNYPLIGRVIGHEMAHGFSDICQNFDKDG